ncbi:gluconokinase [Propionibacteriaceae bacterium Y1923]
MQQGDSAPSQVIIGLDVGTTAVKATAHPIGGGRAITVRREFPLLRPAPGREEQDPDQIVDAVLAALADLAQQLDGTPVLAISCSAAMHGLVGLDADHRPVTPLVTWADSRSTDECAALYESSQAFDVHHLSGVPVHPMSPLTKLMWFARHDPQARVRWWVGLKDYVVWHLTGRLTSEVNSASASGLLAMHTRQWDEGLLELAGITADQLADVHEITDTLPLSAAAAGRCGLPAGLPVVLGAGDGPLANIGVGALVPGVGGLTLGNSGAVRTFVDEPGVDDRGTLFCLALTPGSWVVGGPLSNGGGVISWLLDLLGFDLLTEGPDRSFSDLFELAGRVPPGSEGLVMVPYLIAERAPLWDPSLHGTLMGLQRHHGRGHLVRAAMEGVAMQFAGITDALGQVSPVTSVHASGGAFRSAVWAHIIASVLGRPLTVVGGDGSASLGAAALGLLAVGRATTLDEGLGLLRPGVDQGEVVATDPQEVELYRRLRADVPQLLEDQLQLAAAFPRR